MIHVSLAIFLAFNVFMCIIAVRDELMEAVYIADVSKVRALLAIDPTLLTSRSPVLVNREETNYKRTAIMVCGLDPQDIDAKIVDSHCTTIAELLQSGGANLSHIDSIGWDALSMGAVRGFSQMTDYLLKQGVRVDSVDNLGMTPLMKAGAHGHLETFQILYSYGGAESLTQRDKAGLSALHYVVNIAMSNSSFISFLQSVLTTITATTTQTKLTSHTQPVPQIVSIDSIIDKDGRTILMYAVLARHVRLTDLLLNTFHCNPSLTDKHGVSVSAMSTRLTTSTTGGTETVTQLQAAKEIKRLVFDALVSHAEREHQKWLQESGEEINEDMFSDL